MNPEPTSLKEALDVIRRRDLKIEQLEKEVKELKEEIKEQQQLVGNKRSFSERENYFY